MLTTSKNQNRLLQVAKISFVNYCIVLLLSIIMVTIIMIKINKYNNDNYNDNCNNNKKY